MNEHREHDESGPLTDAVRQFRRAARRAALDPLRLVPPDPLATLARLGAPVAALVGIEPFARLRRAIGEPPAASRSAVAQRRFQSHAGPADAARSRVPAPSMTPVPRRLVHQTEMSARPGAHAAPADGASFRPALSHRDPLPRADVAARRAAARRALEAPDARGRWSPAALVPASTTPARGGRSDEMPDASLPNASGDEHAPAGSALRQLTADPLDLALVEREPPPAYDEPPALDAPHHAAHDGSELHERSGARRLGDGVVPLGRMAQKGAMSWPAPTPAATAGHGDPATAPEEHASPPRPDGLRPLAEGAAQRADPIRAARRSRPDALPEPDPADALFDTLYRSGVDLSWP